MQQQKIFNKHQYRLHRDRSSLKKVHSLHRYVDEDFIDRLAVCKLPDKVNMLEFGGRSNQIIQSIKHRSNFTVSADISAGILNKKNSSHDFKVQCDEELLPFSSDSFDLVISNLHMHWANDIVGALSNCYRVLQKGGVFLLSMIGGQSLSGLRNVFVEVESKNNNVQYHVSPMIKAESLNIILQKIGFNDIVVDSYQLRFECEDFMSMLRSFQDLGESNCLQGKVGYCSRKTLNEVMERYNSKYSRNGKVFCEIELLNALGYK